LSCKNSTRRHSGSLGQISAPGLEGRWSVGAKTPTTRRQRAPLRISTILGSITETTAAATARAVSDAIDIIACTAEITCPRLASGARWRISANVYAVSALPSTNTEATKPYVNCVQ
jgi:hypothetical protein